VAANDTVLTLDEFLDSFPEFEGLVCNESGKKLVNAKLNEARCLVDASVWGGKYEIGVKYKAAHLLAIAPCGRSSGLSDPKEPETVYSKLFSKVMCSVASGCRVI
jgi:hypothetical protein